MRSKSRLKAVIGTLALLIFAAPAWAEDVTVFAAASTAPAMEEVARLYEAEGNGKLRGVFASSGVLARQIYNGAPADLYVSANPDWMDWLIERGAIVGTPVPLLRNRLVLVQPADATLSLTLDASLPHALQGRKLAIGDPAHVPAGIYARQALESLGIWERIESHTVRTKDVRAALYLVGRKEVAAAIVYESDLVSSDRVRLAAAFPADSHAPIVYPAAVVDGGNRPAAQRLLKFLTTPVASEIFRRAGFRTE